MRNYVFVLFTEAASRRCSVKKGVLKNFAKFTGNHLCHSLFLDKVAGQVCNLLKKKTLVQALSCKFCEIFKNAFFCRTPPVAASVFT